MVSSRATFPPLAFVDVETTGLGADHHRIAEIGVVTLDEGRIPTEWGTLLDPGRRIADLPHEFGSEATYFCADRATDLPRFRDIARELGQRLEGRLLIAHNARFDRAYLSAEFERLGLAFAPRVLCSVMLSRRLYPQHACHDLDALCERFGIDVIERHRALPDANLLRRVWEAIARDVGKRKLSQAVAALLEEPLLPSHLDLDMIDALPEQPGVFAFLDIDDQPLLVGRAANLRRQVKRYFHLDRDCARADAISHRLARIHHEAASGPLDARLREFRLRDELGLSAREVRAALSIAVDPSAMPAASIVSLAGRSAVPRDLYGLFATTRKARNALARIVERERVCETFAGLAAMGACHCDTGADSGSPTAGCQHPHYPRNLMRLVAGLSPLRLQSWPFEGPIAIRERRTVHVFDSWEYLGSVRAGSDVETVLQQRRRGFDPRIYALLTRALPRVKKRALHVIAAAPAQRIGRGLSHDSTLSQESQGLSTSRVGEAA